VTGLRIFLSHASEDLGVAGQVHGWLTAAGHEVFLDRHLHDGIDVGDEWEDRLHEQLRRADAVVCIVTRTFVASTWCTAEIAVVRARGGRVLPVRAEPGVDHPLLGSVQYADLTVDRDGARTRLLAAAQRLVISGGRGWSDERSPFPGLRPFEADEHLAFFGRDADVERLTGLLRSPVERAEQAALVVVGPSGCGKSSLVRAGVAPVMAAEEGWRVLPPFVPGTDPVEALAVALTMAAAPPGPAWTVADVRTALKNDGVVSLAHDLLLADRRNPGRHLLVVVDQLEQLVTLTPAPQRACFTALLAAGLAGPVRVVATLRPEFVADPGLADLRTSIQPLAPLGPAALRLAIEGPAELGGLVMPPELVSRLVDETGGGTALPLLAFTLARLTEHAGRGDTVTVAAYERLGGVAGALQTQADAALAAATAATGATRDEVLAVLLTLVAVDAQSRPTGRARHLDERAAAVVAAFVERRLLVTAAAPDRRATTGVAHETFLSAWAPLRDAIAEAATALRARGAVEEAARDWEERDRPAERLWEKGRLSAALADVGARIVPAPDTGSGVPTAPARSRWVPGRSRVLVADRVDLDPASRRFLHASVRRDRFLRSRLVVVLTALLVATGTLAAVAVSRGVRLDRELTAAGAQLLATAAEARARDDPVFASRMALAAWHAAPDDPAARGALARRFVGMRSVERVRDDILGGRIFGMTTADGGRSLIVAHDLGATVVTDPLGSTPVVRHVPGATSGIAYVPSPDGRWLAGVERDGAALLWDLRTPDGPVLLARVAPPTALVAPVLAFSADSSRLILALTDADGGQQASMWDVERRAPLPLPAGVIGEQEIVAGMSFTADPSQVVVTSSDELFGRTRVTTRSLQDGTLRHVFTDGAAGSPTALTADAGPTVVLSCRIADVGSLDHIAVLAADTAAEVARIPLAQGCGSWYLTSDQRHVAELSSPSTTGHRLARIVGIADGGVVDVTIPPAPTAESTRPGTMTVLEPAGGPTTVIVGRQSTLLQLRTTPNPLPADSTPLTTTVDGRHLVGRRGQDVTVRDAVTGSEVTRRTLPAGFGPDDVLDAAVLDRLAVVTRIDGRWQIQTFDLPWLQPVESYRPPGPERPGVAPSESATFDDNRVVAVVGGLLSVWDRSSQRMVSDPVLVWDEPLPGDAVADVAFRPGGRDEVALTARNRPVLVWDIVQRRVTARLPVESPAPGSVFTPDGRRLVVRTANGTFETWDVGAVRRTSTPLFIPGSRNLVGFSGDGYLVSNDENDTLSLWDLDRGAPSGSLPLVPGQRPAPGALPDSVRLEESGRMPTSLPLDARVWADGLCAAVGGYTEAEMRALPAGTQDRRPCP
jgi:WD40 repeat protein